MQRSSRPASRLFFLATAALMTLLVLGAMPADAASGGPGDAGYVWVDRAVLDIPAYAAGGTAINPGADGVTGITVPAGFEFTLFGETSGTRLYVGRDGFISFASGAASSNTPTPIPDGSTPNSLIAPFWTNQGVCNNNFYLNQPAGSGAIEWRTETVAGTEAVAVSWDGLGRQEADGTCRDRNVFAARLFSGTDIMEFQYSHGDATGYAGCYPTVVGIEDQDGVQGFELHSALDNGQAGCTSPIMLVDYGYRLFVNNATDASDQMFILEQDDSVAFRLATSDDPLYHYIPDTDVADGTLTGYPSGIVAYESASVLYAPDPGFAGNDTFVYRVEDGFDAARTATIRFHVNAPPVAADDAFVLSSDVVNEPLDVLDNDSDAFFSDHGTKRYDSPLLKVLDVGTATQGTVTPKADGSGLLYTAGASATGTDRFAYNVTDGRVTAMAWVDIEFDSPPVAGLFERVIPMEDLVLLDVLSVVTDNDHAGLTITSVDGVSLATAGITGDQRRISYDPDLGVFGLDEFTFTVFDGNAETTGNVRIHINAPPAPNDPSSIVPLSSSTLIDVLASASDAYYGTLSLDSVGAASSGTATLDSGKIRYVAPGACGVATVPYVVSDGVTSSSGTLTVGINAPPTPVDDLDIEIIQATVDNAIDVLANDSDPCNDALTITAVSDPPQGTATIVGGQILYTPDGTYTGSDLFTYTVSDGTLTADATVTLDIVSPGTFDVSVAGVSVTEGQTVTLTDAQLSASDVATPANQIVYHVAVAPQHGAVTLHGSPVTGAGFTQQDVLDGWVAYDHHGGELPSDTVTFHIHNATASVAAPMPIQVLPVNDLPVATPGTLHVAPGSTEQVGTLELAVVDPDSTPDATTLKITAMPGVHATLRLAGGDLVIGDSFTYDDVVSGFLTVRDNGAGPGTETIMFQITDQDDASDPKQVVIGSLEVTVMAASDTPATLARNQPLDVIQGRSAAFTTKNLQWTDVQDGPAGIIYTMEDPAPGGGLLLLDGNVLAAGDEFTQQDIDSGRLSYRHDGSQHMSDRFYYHVRDTDPLPPNDWQSPRMEMAIRVLANDVDGTHDGDGDGVPDEQDNCPFTANAAQTDKDMDGEGDACDSFTDLTLVMLEQARLNGTEIDEDPVYKPSEHKPGDFDGDGRLDGVDNCPSLYNPDQANTDGDAHGDVCDDDKDNDGVKDIGTAADNCPLVQNPDQEDMDGDGRGDACDDHDDRLDAQRACPDCIGRLARPMEVSSEPSAAPQGVSLPLLLVSIMLMVLIGAALVFWGIRSAHRTS